MTKNAHGLCTPLLRAGNVEAFNSVRRHPMKTCTYCGLLNTDEALRCSGCGQEKFRPYTNAERLDDELRQKKATGQPVSEFSRDPEPPVMFPPRTLRNSLSMGGYFVAMVLIIVGAVHMLSNTRPPPLPLLGKILAAAFVIGTIVGLVKSART